MHYRYTSNKDDWDTTTSIVVGHYDDGSPKLLHQGGVPVELDDDELANARKRYNLTKVHVEGDEDVKPSGRSAHSAKTEEEAPDAHEGGVPSLGGEGGPESGPSLGDGQGTRGATGTDVGTTSESL